MTNTEGKTMAQKPGADCAFTNPDRFGTRIEESFAGAMSFMRRRYSRDLGGVDVTVTGIPFDLATSNRPGTRFGPRAIRAASTSLAWGDVWPWGFDPFDRLAVTDYGDCAFDFSRPETIPAAIEAHAARILAAGPLMISLGGDHFITLPLLRAHAKKYGEPLALVHFDAHADTGDEDDGINHGTMFRTAARENLIDPKASVQIGIRQAHRSDELGFKVLDAEWLADRRPDEVAAAIRERVGSRKAYLTFDIDCLDPAFAPGTGTPVPGGLTTAMAQRIIRRLGGIDFIGFDFVEVSPPYDVAEITAVAAAALLHDMLCLIAERRKAA